MRIKRAFVLAFACLMAVNCLGAGVAAADMVEPDYSVISIQRATGRFTMDVFGHTITRANESFPLEEGETVTINASYSPSSANVDFGLEDADGMFYYITITDGSINQTIRVSERGNYTFAVRNNSSTTITVTGFVQY